MANVLEKIVADKRSELVQRKATLPLSEFVDALTPSNRSFYDALAKPDAGYIFECKKASPSKGLIRENFDLDEIIDAYGPYAACISVLTDEKYFQGKFEYLEYVREHVTQPVINKDFFVEPYQVYLARHHNADAILLMLSVLSDEEYRELAALAEKYKLDVLTEVSNEEEIERALALKARIIGINNRNLRDLSTDLAMTEKLVPMIKASGHSCLIISESGIYTNQDVRRLAPLVDGFLVGSSVMAEANVKQAVKKLVYGTVKICGITSEDNARQVAESGASYAGLIFHPKSKRFVTTEAATEIVSKVPFNYVGVFVNAPLGEILNTVEVLGLKAVQLHGQEDKQYISELRQLLPAECAIWNAQGVTTVLPEMNLANTDMDLLDCQVGDQSGGTGKVFDWRLLDQVEDKTRVILAGGLNPENLLDAAKTGVTGWDLNSGVEASPGVKDPEKIKQAFRQLRTY